MAAVMGASLHQSRSLVSRTLGTVQRETHQPVVALMPLPRDLLTRFLGLPGSCISPMLSWCAGGRDESQGGKRGSRPSPSDLLVPTSRATVIQRSHPDGMWVTIAGPNEGNWGLGNLGKGCIRGCPYSWKWSLRGVASRGHFPGHEQCGTAPPYY